MNLPNPRNLPLRRVSIFSLLHLTPQFLHKVCAFANKLAIFTGDLSIKSRLAI
ncbi:hypothetical protein HMPREF9103_01435 [Lentilactobacillus parafarraginis F0439]|uniref:Uncharacterized protein n=1 Tax=Lentilactobacillus parafarraginis F0439 TaxID=797515 RepID=G9ZNY1_9LACO|nr:hypothetical protein HMPREF9103_01435 [Lentilactobacillus parafarraginis F0439]